MCALFLEPKIGMGLFVLHLASSLIRTMLDPAVCIKWWENFEESVSYLKYPRLSFSTRCLMVWALELQYQQSLLSRTLECFTWFSATEEIQPECVGRERVVNKPRNMGGCKIIGHFKTRHWMSRPRVLPATCGPGLTVTLEELRSLAPTLSGMEVEGGKL